MARIKIDLPRQFLFTTQVPVRITDVNYGGHVGNDAILSIIHEVRMQFLVSLGYTELKFGGASLIMADAGIEFKNELFYGDILVASVAVSEFSKASFDIYYKLEKQVNDKKVLIAIAKTGMVCFDYNNKKIIPVPEEAKSAIGNRFLD